MTESQEFRFGFLAKCASLGLDAAGVDALLKQALVGELIDGGKKLIGLAAAPVVASVVGAGLLGAAGGHTLAKLQERPVDPSEVRSHELIAAYRSFAAQVRQRNELAARMAATRPGRRSAP